MESTAPKHGRPAPSRSRGGSAFSPLPLAQMLTATAFLIASPILLIMEKWIPGWCAMVIGMLLSLMQFGR